ncbi:hypothetical protein HHK36_015695 [Tetracentron sinense]|uniref:Asparagine synthetase domain-containing protein n=1 Tax=Tetracentron sinense TaxID=13715 RepID=A0A835DDW7_TETSI|nr:hypothetical protein HHK36_015695 [Tetracentron sinense]
MKARMRGLNLGKGSDVEVRIRIPFDSEGSSLFIGEIEGDTQGNSTEVGGGIQSEKLKRFNIFKENVKNVHYKEDKPYELGLNMLVDRPRMNTESPEAKACDAVEKSSQDRNGIDAINQDVIYHTETYDIKALHQYDCLRDNKSISAWSSEARVPFLDKEVINMAMDIDPEWKMIKPNQERIEDWIVRKAFDYEENPYLPKV